MGLGLSSICYMPGPKQAVRTSLSDPHQHLFYTGQSKEYSVTLLSPEKPPRACLSTVLSADVPVLCPCDPTMVATWVYREKHQSPRQPPTGRTEVYKRWGSKSVQKQSFILIKNLTKPCVLGSLKMRQTYKKECSK